jgi:hypothetical protein
MHNGLAETPEVVVPTTRLPRVGQGTAPLNTISPLRYPGAKGKLAAYVAEVLRLNGIRPRLFVEPFAGGAAVSLHVLQSDLVDQIGLGARDPLLASFWETVFTDHEWLIERIETTAVTLETWKTLRAVCERSRREMAFACLFLNRTSFSGILSKTAGPLGGWEQTSKYKIGCRYYKETITTRIRALAALRSRVAFVRNADWSDVVKIPKTLGFETANFFSDETIEVTWAIIRSYLEPRNQSNYIRSFLAADVIGPSEESENRSSFSRARRRRAAVYATLIRANFPVPQGFSTTIAVKKDVLVEINNRAGSPAFQTDARGRLRLAANDLGRFMDALVSAVDSGANLGEWVDSELQAILSLYSGAVGSGFRLLEPLRPYHSTSRTDDYADEILRDLVRGKIVIVDLSLGSETILKFCSERIINYILQDASRSQQSIGQPLATP